MHFRRDAEDCGGLVPWRLAPHLWEPMFDDSPAGMLLVHPDGRLLSVNAAWMAMWRVGEPYVRDRMLGTFNLLQEPQMEALGLLPSLVRALAGEPVKTARFFLDPADSGLDGVARHIDMHFNALAGPAPGHQALLLTLFDVTAQVEAAGRVRKAQSDLRSVIDHAPMLIFLKDLEHRFVLANKEVGRIFGRQDIEGRLDSELFSPAEVHGLHAWDDKVFRTGRVYRFEESLASPGGTRDFLTTKFPLRDGGAVVGVGGITQDVTDRKGIEKENARLMVSEQAAREASGLKSTFLATMSHEIRTPLAGIIGLAEMILDGPLADDTRRHLRSLEQTAQGLLHILNDILEFSKLEAQRITFESSPFSVGNLLESVCATFAAAAQKRGVRLVYRVDQSLPKTLVGDGQRLAQVLGNLVSNAIKFSRDSVVQVAAVRGSKAQFTGAVALRFTVRDQGIGISEESIGRLFTPFTQADGSIGRRFGGTGLGLAISHAIVTGMGGAMGVESEPGQGSEFWLVVPAQACAPHEPGHLTPKTTVDRRPARPALVIHVLVAEDNLVNQTVLMALLTKLGATAELATDGAAAATAAAQRRFDLIIMDCQMPRLDGFEASRRIRAAAGVSARVPIIALTASALTGERERCLAAGMNDFLVKPVNLGQLYDCLHRWAAPAETAQEEPGGA